MAKGDICQACRGARYVYVQPTRTMYIPSTATGKLEKKEVDYGSPQLQPCPLCAGTGVER